MYTSVGAFSPLNQSVILAKITDYIYIFHMPLFMFVSGAVYGLCIQQGKYAKRLDFILNKAKRLLIPYFVFGCFYVAPVMCLTGLTKQGYLRYCFDGIIRSLNSRHLWFLLALFIIFIFAIFLRGWLLKSHYTRAALLVFSGAVYMLARYVPGQLQLNAAFSYQLFFLVGAEFHFYYNKLEPFLVKFRYTVLILPFILVGWFFYCPNIIFTLGYTFAGILMIVLLAVLLEKETKLVETKFFRRTKDTSMGVFLFHPMIVYLGYYCLGNRDISPYLLSVGIAVFAFYTSIFLTKAVRRLKLGVILGEK
jgi:fucose 4-O-acetylase-like acetyltransferase